MPHTKLTISTLLLLLLTVHSRGFTQTVSVYQTTKDGNQKLTRGSERTFRAASCGGDVINVSDAVQYQAMDGFGAAMTGSAAYLMNNEMTEAQRNTLMNDLFGSDGIGLSFVRHSIGASDFSLSDYTYHDPGNTFSADVDKADVIPMLLQAKAVNAELKIMGTPWTAPAWMKTNGSMKGGSLTDDHLDDFALYLVRYMEAFEGEGLPIYAITMQNEPLNETSAYPSMRMEWFQQSNLLRYHLGPLMADRSLTTKVLLYDHNWDETNYAKDILSIPETAQYAAGTAFHGYAGSVDAQSTVYNHDPDKGIWFTEQSGGGWSPNFDENLDWYAQNLIMGAIKNWSKSVVLWNLALNTEDGPQNGGCSNCRGVVTINDDGTYTKEIEYYVLGHLSKFVMPDATRIYSNDTEKVQSIAFRNPDGSMVLVAYNKSDSNSYVRINTDDQEFGYTIPAGALVSFVWEP